MIHFMYKHFIFGGGFGFTCMYVCMLLSMYKHLIFGVFLGYRYVCMYVCMLLSIYKHLIFGGGGLGLQSLRSRT